MTDDNPAALFIYTIFLYLITDFTIILWLLSTSMHSLLKLLLRHLANNQDQFS